jgi:hypothetical protein
MPILAERSALTKAGTTKAASVLPPFNVRGTIHLGNLAPVPNKKEISKTIDIVPRRSITKKKLKKYIGSTVQRSTNSIINNTIAIDISISNSKSERCPIMTHMSGANSATKRATSMSDEKYLP